MSPKNLIFYAIILVALVLVVIFVVKPVLGQIFGFAGTDSITIGARNAVSVYMYEDIDHVAHPRDLALVYGEYIVYVHDNDSQGGNYTKPIVTPERVTFEGPCTGEYESGVYVRRKEDTVFVVQLSPGDSVDGLYKANVPVMPELAGYVYYGTAEKFDIYEKR